ncbi:uncharacterized protein J3D65DRAFT_22628 [Phyllosticta citribraziliensis]|uniref:Uncharacterized protein n=1 Tax=Phyllosticta citribraziliensis TaxID=989973 RepID=A0ABR1MB95_9PEZI
MGLARARHSSMLLNHFTTSIPALSALRSPAQTRTRPALTDDSPPPAPTKLRQSPTTSASFTKLRAHQASTTSATVSSLFEKHGTTNALMTCAIAATTRRIHTQHAFDVVALDSLAVGQAGRLGDNGPGTHNKISVQASILDTHGTEGVERNATDLLAI